MPAGRGLVVGTEGLPLYPLVCYKTSSSGERMDLTPKPSKEEGTLRSVDLPRSLIQDIQEFDRQESANLPWKMSRKKVAGILAYVQSSPGCTTKEVAEALKHTPRLVGITLRKLWGERLVSRSARWRGKKATFLWAALSKAEDPDQPEWI